MSNYFVVSQLLRFPPGAAPVSEGVLRLDGVCGDVFLSAPPGDTKLILAAKHQQRPAVLTRQTFPRVWVLETERQMSGRAEEI